MEFIIDNLKYTTLETAGTVSVKPVSGATYTDLVIPATVEYEGTVYTVAQVPTNAFHNAQISTLTLPSGIELGYGCFDGATMTAVYFSGPVVFANNSFRDCDSLLSVNIPAGTNINSVSYAFGYCDSLTEVTFNEGQQQIGNAIDQCNNLETVNLPSTITTLGDVKWYNSKITKQIMPFSTPVTIASISFPKSTEFQVPAGSVSAYLADGQYAKHTVYSMPSIRYISDSSLYREDFYKSGDAVTAPSDPTK